MSAAVEQRRKRRVRFERGFECRIMAIDGTWQIACVMRDVSETGAKLSIKGSIEKLPMKEFFLVLSSTGLAYRRCTLKWVSGESIGVEFLRVSHCGFPVKGPGAACV